MSRTALLEPRARLERPRPVPAERREAEQPPPEIPRVLAAGNQAVARMVARFGVADVAGGVAGGVRAGVETLTQLATSEIHGSVGRGGRNDAVDVAIVRGLLQAVGFADPDLGAAIERYQLEVLGWSQGDGRVDPGRKTLRALRRGRRARSQSAGEHNEHVPDTHAGDVPKPHGAGGIPARNGGQTTGHTPVPGPAHEPEPHPGPVPAPDDPARREAERVFREFASARAPLFAAMQGATDDEARRQAMQTLREFDAARLPQLRALKATLGGRWDIGDPSARDAVLGAIQLEAATDAMGDLLRNNQDVHKRVADASGMPMNSAWCGMFTVDHFRHSGMDADLAAGFLHVDNVHDFFTYRHERNPRRVPKWIWADHEWHDLHAYHQARGSERHWLDGAEVWKGGNLDVRPGDVALIDHNADGKADHIVKVQSYDANTSTLLTIGGNDAGYVIDHHPRANRKVGSDQSRAEVAAGGEALGREGWHGEYGAGGGHVGLSVHHVLPDGRMRGTIFGVGRPSLIDFEDHPYDHGNNLRKPPPTLRE